MNKANKKVNIKLVSSVSYSARVLYVIVPHLNHSNFDSVEIVIDVLQQLQCLGGTSVASFVYNKPSIFIKFLGDSEEKSKFALCKIEMSYLPAVGSEKSGIRSANIYFENTLMFYNLYSQVDSARCLETQPCQDVTKDNSKMLKYFLSSLIVKIGLETLSVDAQSLQAPNTTNNTRL